MPFWEPLSPFITYLDPEESRASAHVFTKRIKPLRAFSSWKDQTNQEIGLDEGERELLLKEREPLLLTSLLMNRIFYWNRIHSNRWTEPTCCCWWKSSHWKKQAKNPTNLLDPEKKGTNGMRKTLLVDLRSVFKYRIKGAKSMAAYSATMGSASFLF